MSEAATNSTPPAPPALDPGRPEREAEAEREFDRGHWRRAAQLARAEVTSPVDGRRQAARATLDRLRPDPALSLVYLASLLAFILTVVRIAR